MTLDDVRAAAIDRALVGDDPESALALAGAVDRTGLDSRNRPSLPGDHSTTAPFTAAMLAIAVAATTTDRRPLDDRAWQPGTSADPLVLAGAAVAVRTRNVAVDRMAELADCTPATLEAAVERQRRREKEGCSA